MSTPNQGQGQGPPPPPHVVQTILESFTRCFAPIDDECSSMDARPPTTSWGLGGGRRSSPSCGGGAAIGSSRAGASPVVHTHTNTRTHNLGYSCGVGVGVDVGGGMSNNNVTRAVSRSVSSSDSRKKPPTDRLFHDDDQARHRRAQARSGSGRTSRTIPSAEELQERSMKRKLEIFRGGGSSEWTNSFAPSPRGPQQHPRQSPKLVPRLQQPRQQQQRQPSPTSSDDEEELQRLIQNSRNRFACGLPLPTIGGGCTDEDDFSPDSPLRNIGRKFIGNIYGCNSQAQGFLCFATPVRTASGEDDVANLSDDKLTADEFLSRHGGGGGTAPPGPPNQVSPDHHPHASSGRSSAQSHASGSVYTEDQTVESQLYFDQKYSHVIQTRPPMPLFQENMVTTCTGGGGGRSHFSGATMGNELSTIIKKQRSTSQPPREVGVRSSHGGSRASPPIESNMNYEYEYCADAEGGGGGGEYSIC